MPTTSTIETKTGTSHSPAEREVLAELPGPVLPPAAPDETQTLFRQLASQKGLNLIFGVSGRMKSVFAMNLACHAFESGGRAGIVSFEGSPQQTARRLGCMIGRLPIDDSKTWPPDTQAELLALASTAQYGPDGRLRLGLQFPDPEQSSDPDRLIAYLLKLAAEVPDGVVIIDGLEGEASWAFDPGKYANFMESLSHADLPGLGVWLTTQADASACDREILTLQHIHSSLHGKAEIFTTIVGIGSRTPDNLIKAACVVKCKGGWLGAKHVRLRSTASLRLETMPVTVLPPAEAQDYASQPETPLRLPAAIPEPVDARAQPPPAAAEPAPTIAEEADATADDTVSTALSNCGSIPPVPEVSCSGFADIRRDIMLTDWWTSASWSDRGLWLYLALRAAWAPIRLNAPKTAVEVEVARGEYMTSVRQLARQTRQTDKAIRGFLERTRQAGIIRVFNIDRSGRRTEVGETAEASARGRVIATVIRVLHVGRALSAGSKQASKGQKGHRAVPF